MNHVSVTDPEDPMAKATKQVIDFGIEKEVIKPDHETIVQKYWVTY